MQFFYCKDKSRVEPVKKIPTFVRYNNLRRSKLPIVLNQYLIYDNHKVIIFNLLNYISPLIPKLHGKMKLNDVSRMTLT